MLVGPAAVLEVADPDMLPDKEVCVDPVTAGTLVDNADPNDNAALDSTLEN